MKEKQLYNINKLRKEINIIDKEIIKLLKKRSFIIPKVKIFKENMPYKIAFKREYEMAKKFQKANFGLYNNTYMQKIWRELISATLYIENNLTIGILSDNNISSTFEVAKDHFGIYTNYEFLNAKELFEKLDTKKLDAIVLPKNNLDWFLNLLEYKNIFINLELPMFKNFKTLNKNTAFVLSLNNKDIFNYKQFAAVYDNNNLLENKDIKILKEYNNIKFIEANFSLGNKFNNVIFLGSSSKNL